VTLETVDLNAIEILKVGGPVHGIGSAAGGDFITTSDLRALAEADAELGDEINPPAKIGHGSTDPAVGWVENLRLNADGSRLLADVKRVPRQVAELVRAGAYRTRSVELGRFTSQRTGRKYDQVVGGLAFLGGRMPAVAGLTDVTRLYSTHVEPVRVYEFTPTTPTERNDDMSTQLIDRALEDGRIDASEGNDWVRRFEIDAGLTARLLESRKPDFHQSLRNRSSRVTSAVQETEEEARRYLVEFETMHGGQSTREINSDDDGYSAAAAARLGISEAELI
jgi:hypothetical protein